MYKQYAARFVDHDVELAVMTAKELDGSNPQGIVEHLVSCRNLYHSIFSITGNANEHIQKVIVTLQAHRKAQFINSENNDGSPSVAPGAQSTQSVSDGNGEGGENHNVINNNRNISSTPINLDIQTELSPSVNSVSLGSEAAPANASMSLVAPVSGSGTANSVFMRSEVAPAYTSMSLVAPVSGSGLDCSIVSAYQSYQVPTLKPVEAVSSSNGPKGSSYDSKYKKRPAPTFDGSRRDGPEF